MKDIESMAREAGMVVVDDQFSLLPFLVRFADLVRAQALEDGAKYLQDVHPTRLVKFADAIRALGRKV